MADPTTTARAYPFRRLAVPARLWVPCAARGAASAVAARAAGTVVHRGEPLTDDSADNNSGPAVLAPVPGRIVAAGDAVLLNQRRVPAIILETDPAATDINSDSADDPATVEDARAFLSDLPDGGLVEHVAQLARLGVWADRWTSPDLLGQLCQCAGRPIDAVVCNVLDPDPTLPVNRATAAAHGPELVAAVAALARLTRARRVWAVVDGALPTAHWAPMREAAAAAAGDLRIVPLENDYPQADPTLLLYTLAGRSLRFGRLPTEQGVLLLDAAAAVAVGRAMLRGEPMLRVPLAVYDRLHDATHLVSACVGTRLSDVLAALGVPRHGVEFRAGGPLRDVRVPADAVVAGGELGVCVVAREPEVNVRPCIRCGWCVEGCPVRIHPAGLLEASQQDDLAMARGYGLAACIECGICSYVCPSHLPLLPAIREMRGASAAPDGDHAKRTADRSED